MDYNNNGNQSGSSNSNRSDYTSPEPYNPDAQYGFPTSDPGAQSGFSSDDPASQYGSLTDDPGAPDTSRDYGYVPIDPNQPRSGYDENGQYQGMPDTSQKRDDYSGGYSYNPNTYSQQPGYSPYGSDYSYGGGNYGYSARDSAPRDKKGRAIPNNFGMKLTFAIIEIVLEVIASFLGLLCFTGIPLVLSIIALVFVCQQNNAYKECRWSEFVSKKKTSAVLLWIAFIMNLLAVATVVVLILMVVLGYGAFGDALSSAGYNSFGDLLKDYQAVAEGNYSEEEMQEILEDMLRPKDESDESGSHAGSAYGTQSGADLYVQGFNEFEVNGEAFALPISVKEFLAKGFKMDKEDRATMIQPMSYDAFSYYDAQDGYVGTLFIYNVTGEEQKASKGIIGCMTIQPTDAAEIEMVNGITFSSSPEDVIDAIGLPTETTGDEELESLSWYMYDDYGQSLQFDFVKGQMMNAWITNDADLKDQIGY